MNKIIKIRFDNDYIYGYDESGKEYRQSLLWYPRLQNASDEERNCFTFSTIGIHWRNIDEDVSFESFCYDDAEPSPIQKFFLSHKEINVAEFAKIADINPTLLRNYINGFKKPSEERIAHILETIHKIGREYENTSF